MNRVGDGKQVAYARSTDQAHVYLHRLIGGPEARGKVVDHINGDTMDNRRCNLRVCTQRENARNRRAVRGFRGVSWKADSGKWRARIMVDRREFALGAFDTQEAAAIAYNHAATKYHGAFAKLNVIPEEQEKRHAA